MKRQLEEKKNKNCTFIQKIKKINRSKSANRKTNYNKSAFLKEGLSNYFNRLDRAKKMKKGNLNKTPPPLERKRSISAQRNSRISQKSRNRKSKHDNSKYESRFRPMEMQKTEEDFYPSNKEKYFGSSKYHHEQASQYKEKNKKTNQYSEINDNVLKDLSKRDIMKEGSPPTSSYSSRAKNEPNVFAAHTKQLIQGLFSSNETGSLGLIGSKYIKQGNECNI